MRDNLKIVRREMVELEMCLDGLLKPLGCVETFKERKTMSVQEMMSFFNEVLNRDGKLINNGGKAKASNKVFVIEVEKLEGATKSNINDEEIPSMEVGMIVDEIPSMGDSKITS